MDTTRSSIRDTVGELRDKVSETVDWRHYVTRYPGASLGLAAATGLLLGRWIAGLMLIRSVNRSSAFTAVVRRAAPLLITPLLARFWGHLGWGETAGNGRRSASAGGSAGASAEAPTRAMRRIETTHRASHQSGVSTREDRPVPRSTLSNEPRDPGAAS